MDMRFNETLRRVVALACVVQVCLLSLASVSPSIHQWVFHGRGSAEASLVGSNLCDHTHGHQSDSSPADQSGKQNSHDDSYCPVSLFSHGATPFTSELFSLIVQKVFSETIVTANEKIALVRRAGSIQARAPPHS